MYRRIKRVHFVGIGGIGMCGLAELLAQPGLPGHRLRPARGRRPSSACAGSASRSRIGHDAAHVGDADVVVYSSAVRPRQPGAASRRSGARSR